MLLQILACTVAFACWLPNSANGQVNYPPRMVKVPDREALFQYNEATKLDCKADGYPEPTYQWRRNLMSWNWMRNDGRYTKWPGEGTLVFALPGQDDDGMYQCIATNNLGSALSPVVNMRRADLKDFTPSQIRYVTVSPGEYIMLKCTVPTSYPPPIVAWSIIDKNGQISTIKETNRRAVDVDGNLHIAAVTEDDNGMFICTANNLYLRVMKQGERHSLTVRQTSTMESQCQLAARSPETQLAIINGTNVHLKCIIACSPPPQYTWLKLGQADDYVQTTSFLTIANSGTELVINVTSVEAAGVYRCTGRNERSSKYPMFQYTVYVESVPTFTVKPEDKTIEEFGSHVFRCEATGIPAPTIKWTVNGNEPSTYMDGVRKRLEGNVIYLNNMTIKDAAVFQCNASNSHGYAFTNAFLNVLRDRPAFMLAPQENLTMAVGQNVDLHCQTFSAPKAVISWTKNGRRVNGGRYIMLENGDLRIESLTAQDAGNYTCHAKNKFGENYATGSLRVRQPTKIRIPPYDTRVYENKDVKFVCTAETDPDETLTVNWFKDGSPLNPQTNPRVQFNIQDNSLIITGAMPRDTGMYTCNATNGIDYDTRLVSLVVQGRPDRPDDISADCVEQIQSRYAVLNWRPGADNYAPIIGYIVEFSTQFERETWYIAEMVNYNSSNDNSGKAQLRPYLDYRFRVRSKNRVGISEPSPNTINTCSIPPTIPNDNPKELYVYGTQSKNLVIQWTTLPYIQHNGANLGYELTVRCLDCTSTTNNKDNVTSVADWRVDRVSYEFMVLDKVQYRIEEFRTYRVSIRSRNDMGQSSAAPTVAEGYSGGDVPTIAPTDASIVDSQPGQVVVQWRVLQQADLKSVRGFFQGYRVEWCMASLSEGDCFFQRRYKDEILRNFTAPIKFGRRRRRSVTFDGSLQSPMALRRARRSLTGIEEKTSAAESTDTELERFRRSSGLPPAVALEVFSRQRREVRDIPWGQMMTTTIENLPGNANIRIYVRILNTLFAGPPSTPMEVTTMPTVPDPVNTLRVVNTGVNQVELAWSRPANINGQLVGYQIGVQELNRLELGFLTRYPKIYDPDLVDNVVAGLKPRTRYRVFIWPFNDAGYGMDTFVDIETSPTNAAPSPPTFWVEPVGKTSFNVSFSPSRTGVPGSVFFAQYRLYGVNRWEETRPEYQRRWINISGLAEDQWYEVRMVATNGASMTQASQISRVKSSGVIDRYNPLKGASATWFIIIILILIVIAAIAVGLYFFRKKRQEEIYGKQPLVNEDTKSGNPSNYGPGFEDPNRPVSPPQEFYDDGQGGVEGSMAYSPGGVASPPSSQMGGAYPGYSGDGIRSASPDDYDYEQDGYQPRVMSPGVDSQDRLLSPEPGMPAPTYQSPSSGRAPRPGRPGGYTSPQPSSSIHSGAQSQGSGGSQGSKRGRAPQYRCVNNHSMVDENLFGDPNHVKQRQKILESREFGCGEDSVNPLDCGANCSSMCDPRRSLKAKSGCAGQKETVTVIDKDLIRNLVVPSQEPQEASIVLPFEEFQRLRNRAKVLTPEEQEEERQRIKAEKDKLMEESAERKRFMKQMDISRRKNEKLTDLEEEARMKAQHLLQKAMEQRQDQEDEIKALNELILNAKIQAIRDAQLLEKSQIKKELVDEDLRLDKMMEVERRNAIAIQEQIDERRREEEKIGAMQILKQIEENEQERLLALEKKDQENKAQHKYIAQLMEEEYQRKLKHRVEQEKLREEFHAANEEMIKRKYKEKEVEKLKDFQVLEYQKQKAEREAAFEREQERIKIEKEKEIARLRALQERAKDEQAERDALRAKRAAEEAEREWRRKEAAEARKKQETEEELRQARAMQAQQKQHFLAVQAGRDRFEFERVLRAQKELIEKDRQNEEMMKKRYAQYSQEIRAQIRDKEQEKILERAAFFEEGVRMEEEARLRRQRLEEAKARKLVELRNVGIPERYLAQVERKVHQKAAH